MEHAQLVKAFAATVQASLHGLQTLEPILVREREALSGREPDRLEAVVREKLTELKSLEPSIKARDRLLAIAGLVGGIEGGGQLVSQVNDIALAEHWSQLVDLAGRVAALNDQNAQLANQGQRATRAALGILTGRPDRDDTYASLRRGRSNKSSSHTLGVV